MVLIFDENFSTKIGEIAILLFNAHDNELVVVTTSNNEIGEISLNIFNL